MSDIFIYLKEHLDIVDVINNYVSLSQIGNYYKGLSPFKHEKTPSFTVTPDKKIFYCFSTSIGGDVVDFISRVENCSQLEAAYFLIAKYNISLPSQLKIKKTEETHFKEIYFKIYSLFITWCQNHLSDNRSALEYVKNRGINEHSIAVYSIGYCPSNNYINSFLEYVKKNNILLEDILKTDIVVMKNKKYYLTAQDRIIFPIKNTLQLFCGYGGRTIQANDIRSKYVNTTSNDLFVKKSLLYGFSEAREEIKKNQSVYIVEGYIDVIAMSQVGYKNTVATMGTAMTKHHVDLIKKFAKSVSIMYDGDEAGKNAIMKSLFLFWNEDIDVNIVELPSDEDPASLCFKNNIQECIHKKISAISFFLKKERANLLNNNLSDINKLLYDIVDVILNIDDDIKKMGIIIKISEELLIPKEFFISLMKKKKLNGSNIGLLKCDKKNQEKKQHVMQPSDGLHEKYLWYLFFYINLYFFKDAIVPMKRVIFIFKAFGIHILGDLLQQYFDINGNSNYIDFLKYNNLKIYNHCLKYMSIYNFSKEQYLIVYNKIITISWKMYRIENKDINFKDFLLYID